MTTQEKLEKLYGMLKRTERLSHAIRIINYDMETAAPEGGMEDDGNDVVCFSNEIFAIEKSDEFISLVKDIHDNDAAGLDAYDTKLIHDLYRSVRINEGIDEATNAEANELFAKAYRVWLKAKNENDYSQFAPTLEAIYRMQMKLLSKRYDFLPDDPYTTLFGDYEEGFTSQDLDTFFDDLEKGIVPLLRKVRASSYTPRHDFLNRPVAISKQEDFTTYLLGHNGFDFKRGSVSTTEHPFTEQFGENDVRVTTKYFETNFISNMYSVIHEGGHAIFGQNIPKDCFTHHLGEGVLTMAKHESVSRFYENVLGRSQAYIDGIYPSFHKLFKDELGDVSAHDFYEGVNYVDLGNPLRTEADELTYSLHIIIRYRLERMIMAGKADFAHLNETWNRLYKEILGIDVRSDREGILQDVHWSSGFGYFPTYALGNALNAIYVGTLRKTIDLDGALRAGDMKTILDWMRDNVFSKAPTMTTKSWIKAITGEDFSAKPYVDYLTKKYTEIYHLED